MSLFGRAKPASEDEQGSAELARAVREKRLEIARSNRLWREVEETALVRRGPFLVHAETDELWTLARGAIFATGTASLMDEVRELAFAVDAAGELTFFQRCLNPTTWSEVVQRRARKMGAAA